MVRFWDVSALIPLWIQQTGAPMVRPVMDEDPQLAVWWGTVVECTSAIARLSREGLDTGAIKQASAVLQAMARNWAEVEPSAELRDSAERLLWLHPLRAADALQLPAALRWCDGHPEGPPSSAWTLGCGRLLGFRGSPFFPSSGTLCNGASPL